MITVYDWYLKDYFFFATLNQSGIKATIKRNPVFAAYRFVVVFHIKVAPVRETDWIISASYAKSWLYDVLVVSL